jgi:hypothetical protein
VNLLQFIRSKILVTVLGGRSHLIYKEILSFVSIKVIENDKDELGVGVERAEGTLSDQLVQAICWSRRENQKSGQFHVQKKAIKQVRGKGGSRGHLQILHVGQLLSHIYRHSAARRNRRKEQPLHSPLPPFSICPKLKFSHRYTSCSN